MIQFNKTIFQFTKRLALIIVSISSSIIAIADSGKYYAKVTVNSDPAGENGKGYVYVTTDSVATANYAAQSTAQGEGDNFKILFNITYDRNVTFYLHADPTFGGDSANYIWAGWYEDGTPLPGGESYQLSQDVRANSQDESNPTTKTYTARWLQPEVNNVSHTTIDFGKFDNPDSTGVDTAVVFDILNYKDGGNFNDTIKYITTPPSINTIGFIPNSVFTAPVNLEGKDTVKLKYAPQGIDGVHKAIFQLSSALYPDKTTGTNYFKTCTLTVKEDYTPYFYAKYNKKDEANGGVSLDTDVYDFGEITISSDATSPSGELQPNLMCFAARQPQGPAVRNTTWSTTIIEQSEGDLFTIVENCDQANPQVYFNADATKVGMTENQTEKTFTAKLKITCSYKDNANQTLTYEDYTYVTATVIRTDETKLEIAATENTIDFGSVYIGDDIEPRNIKLKRINILESSINLNKTNDPKNIFNVSYSGGNVQIKVNEDIDCTLCDEDEKYETTITINAKGIKRDDNGNTTYPDVEPVEIKVSIETLLKNPQLKAVGGDRKVTFTWDPVPGAEGYNIYSCGDSENPLNGETLLTECSYTISNLKGNSKEFEKSCQVEAVRGECTSLSNCETESPSLKYITSSNANNTGLSTGTDLGNVEESYVYAYPFHEVRSIDVSCAFNGTTPIFDYLYIFGLTTELNGTETLEQAKSKAVTPVYVYKKSGEQYELQGEDNTIDNINSNTKNNSYFKCEVIKNQKIYFTGYCPFASTGDAESNGVMQYIGNSQITLDIYLDSLQVYANDNSGSITLTADDDAILDEGAYYASGSGAVFAMQSTSTNTGYPFNVNIHVRGNNTLDAGKGASIKLHIDKEYGRKGVKLIDDAPQHLSSPITILPQGSGGKNQALVLSIDDCWKANEDHTNGILVLTDQRGNNSGASIDLGNAYSSLDIKGGQIYFQETGAAYYATEYVTSGDAQISIKAYGLSSNGITNSSNGTASTNNKSVGRKISLKDGTYNGIEAVKLYAQNLSIDGGSFNQRIQHYVNATDTATALYDKAGKELKRATIDYTLDDNGTCEYGSVLANGSANINAFAKMMDDLFPDYGVNNDMGSNINYHYSLSAYYPVDEPYGHASVTPKADTLHFMLPWLDCKSLKIPWQICSPSLTAQHNELGINMNLGGSIHKIKGCPNHDDSQYSIDRLLHMQIDEYTTDAFADYTLYSKGISLIPDNDSLYSTIYDDSNYTINEKVYMLIPIEAAKWTLFTAPFNVANVYVIESYPETQLVKDFNGVRGYIKGQEDINNARIAQAQRLIDLYGYWYYEKMSLTEPQDFFNSNSTTDIDGDGNADKYGQFVLDWITYEKTRLDNKDKDASANYIPVIDKLQHYWAKRDAEGNVTEHNLKTSHYYLYKAGADWEYDGANFTSNWIDITDEVKEADGALMKQGETYIMQFPYNSIGGVHDPSTTWDYWTGKYLLIESTAGPHIINGNNYKNSMLPTTINSESAALCGNATFANLRNMTAPESANYNLWGLKKVHGGGDDIEAITKDSYTLESKSSATLAPTEGLLLANFTAPANMRAKSINYYTGEVEYEKIDNIDPGLGSGVPTIMNGMSLIVEPTAEGLTITPLKEQHVMLFDAEGKMIFSKYMSEEENVSLPTGVYVVRGEYEQVKAIKK